MEMLLTRQICTNENSFYIKKNPCHEKTIRNGGSGSTALRNKLLIMLTLLDNIYYYALPIKAILPFGLWSK